MVLSELIGGRSGVLSVRVVSRGSGAMRGLLVRLHQMLLVLWMAKGAVRAQEALR